MNSDPLFQSWLAYRPYFKIMNTDPLFQLWVASLLALWILVLLSKWMKNIVKVLKPQTFQFSNKKQNWNQDFLLICLLAKSVRADALIRKL